MAEAFDVRSVPRRRIVSALHWFALALAVLPAIALVLVVAFVGYLLIGPLLYLGSADEVAVVVPGSSSEIVFRRVLRHPMIAEYERTIDFVEMGTKVKSSALRFDTCGGYPMNIYLLEADRGLFLRLDDSLFGHLIDPSSHRVYLISFDDTGLWLGPVSTSGSAMGWSQVERGPKVITVDGRPAVPIEDVTGSYRETYLGKLGGPVGSLNFVPATDGPPAVLDYLRPRPLMASP